MPSRDYYLNDGNYKKVTLSSIPQKQCHSYRRTLSPLLDDVFPLVFAL